MKYTAAIVAFAGLAAAQSLADIPQCAQQCLANAITASGQCTLGDTACLCIPANFQAIITAGAPCVIQNCGNDVTVNQVIPAAGRICVAVAGGAGAAGTASAAASAAASTAAVASSRASSAAITSAASSAASAATTRVVVVTSSVTARNGTATATTTQVPVTVNGAATQGHIGFMAALALGALAYL